MKINESQRVGIGRSPAVIVIDMARSLTDPISPAYVPAATLCLGALVQLLTTARSLGIPRFFTRGGLNFFTHKDLPFSPPERGAWAFKHPLQNAIQDHSLWDLAPELEIQPGEIVIEKTKPSAFFGTPLMAYLTHLGIDTVIIGGMVTSGCVRCTAVDAFSHNLRVIMPLECMADRRPEAHANSLTDLDWLYGDVLPAADVIGQMQTRYASFSRPADHTSSPAR